MIIVILWIALFVDALESFQLPIVRHRCDSLLSHHGYAHLKSDDNRCDFPRTYTPFLHRGRGGRSSLSTRLRSTNSDDDSAAATAESNVPRSCSNPETTLTTNYTITLPPFLSDDDGHNDVDDKAVKSYPSPLHHIYVEPVLTRFEANRCHEMAKSYADRTNSWNERDTQRHEVYSTCDFPIEECPKLESYLQDELQFDDRIFGRLGELYGVDVRDMQYLDLFCAQYQAQGGDTEGGGDTMDRLEAHRDGSLLSFSLLLNDEADFEGGGTFYDALRDDEQQLETVDVLQPGGVIRPKQGDCTFHCGKILHGADVVTSGRRTVMVGFVEVHERNQREGALGEACTQFGRMDVALKRWETHLKRLAKQRGRQQLQQQEEEAEEEKGGSKWLTMSRKLWRPRSTAQLVLKSMPLFSSVDARADAEFQRLRKLEAEDKLLRNVLLPAAERKEIGVLREAGIESHPGFEVVEE